MPKNILNLGGFTIKQRIGNGARSTIYLASDDEDQGRPRLVRGTYQSPILVQWRKPRTRTRRLEVQIYRYD